MASRPNKSGQPENDRSIRWKQFLHSQQADTRSGFAFIGSVRFGNHAIQFGIHTRGGGVDYLRFLWNQWNDRLNFRKIIS